jgi:hypothetical protein
MVAGFADVVETADTLVAEARNHPNLLVLPLVLNSSAPQPSQHGRSELHDHYRLAIKRPEPAGGGER